MHTPHTLQESGSTSQRLGGFGYKWTLVISDFFPSFYSKANGTNQVEHDRLQSIIKTLISHKQHLRTGLLCRCGYRRTDYCKCIVYRFNLGLKGSVGNLTPTALEIRQGGGTVLSLGRGQSGRGQRLLAEGRGKPILLDLLRATAPRYVGVYRWAVWMRYSSQDGMRCLITAFFSKSNTSLGRRENKDHHGLEHEDGSA